MSLDPGPSTVQWSLSCWVRVRIHQRIGGMATVVVGTPWRHTLQSAYNLLNTYGDYETGLDTEDNHTVPPNWFLESYGPRTCSW